MFPFRLTKKTPIMEIINPRIKKGVMCFFFYFICVIIAVNKGQIETITLTFEAVVKLIAMFSENWYKTTPLKPAKQNNKLSFFAIFSLFGFIIQSPIYAIINLKNKISKAEKSCSKDFVQTKVIPQIITVTVASKYPNNIKENIP